MKIYKRNYKKIILLFLAVLYVLITIFPLWSALVVSLSPEKYVGRPSLLPQEWSLKNYLDVWHEISLMRSILNGIFYSTVSVIIVLIIAIPTAYAISRFVFIGKKYFLLIILITQMLSAPMIILPLFLFFLKLNLLDTRFSVVVIISGFALPMAIWILQSHFGVIPKEIEEAAMVDGCNRIQAIYYIILPILAPALAATSAIVFTHAYKEFFVPLVFLNSSNKYPALVGIYTLAAQTAPPWHYIMTASLITIVPILIFFFISSNSIKSGISEGGVKM